MTIVIVVIGGQVLRFGFHANYLAPVGSLRLPAFVLSIILIVGWLLALRLAQSYDRAILTSGAAEYNRVLAASFGFFGSFAILDLLFKLDVARTFIAVVFPAGAVLLLLSRVLSTRQIVRGRKRGRYLNGVLVVGRPETATAVAAKLDADPALGYEVVGLCVAGSSDPRWMSSEAATPGRGSAETPVFLGLDRIVEALAHTGATAVAVTDPGMLAGAEMRELIWDIESDGIEVLVSPGLAGVAGPRITLRPQAGLPLIHVDRPRYEGANRYGKAIFDRIGAALGLLLLAPVFVAVAIAIKVESRGPVFYRSERIGANNRPFEMWKFRSMVTGADQMREDIADQDDGNGVLFKVKGDPRVTRVGKFIRRFSLDELPQLFNVLGGTMSLAGPRPPLREEVARYDAKIVRRMLVRPGMTGLWQVSGRSDLSWEESIELDLYYVENWSLMGDLLIFWRTIRAVFSSEGAY
ncbi:sugar transferase [Gordonia iterans]